MDNFIEYLVNISTRNQPPQITPDLTPDILIEPFAPAEGNNQAESGLPYVPANPAQEILPRPYLQSKKINAKRSEAFKNYEENQKQLETGNSLTVSKTQSEQSTALNIRSRETIEPQTDNVQVQVEKVGRDQVNEVEPKPSTNSTQVQQTTFEEPLYQRLSGPISLTKEGVVANGENASIFPAQHQSSTISPIQSEIVTEANTTIKSVISARAIKDNSVLRNETAEPESELAIQHSKEDPVRIRAGVKSIETKLAAQSQRQVFFEPSLGRKPKVQAETETTVTIHIGRIEVRVVREQEPTVNTPRTPVLSLGDYLKKRSEEN